MSRAYQKITDRIIERLEAGVVPWRRPWGLNLQGNLITPTNLQTHRLQ